jgi:hypothetical protein
MLLLSTTKVSTLQRMPAPVHLSPLAPVGAPATARPEAQPDLPVVVQSFSDPRTAEHTPADAMPPDRGDRADTVLRSADTAEAASSPWAGMPETVQRAAAAASPGIPGATASPEELDELARRLYAPMVRRLKADLLLDRDRRGLRTDRW